MTTNEEAINTLIKGPNVNTNLISDGYHTFEELYEHRIELFIALCVMVDMHGAPLVWKSWRHSDGELAFGGGWFLLGIGKDKGQQITYHLPSKYWGRCQFMELEQAPKFDGHTPKDVLQRLQKIK